MNGLMSMFNQASDNLDHAKNHSSAVIAQFTATYHNDKLLFVSKKHKDLKLWTSANHLPIIAYLSELWADSWLV